VFVVGLLAQQLVLGSTVASLLGAVLGQGLQEAEQWAPQPAIVLKC
jgi:hypothetical protein